MHIATLRVVFGSDHCVSWNVLVPEPTECVCVRVCFNTYYCSLAARRNRLSTATLMLLMAVKELAYVV